MNLSRNSKKGIFYSILTAVISGAAIFYNKQLLVTGIDPLPFNIIKNGGTAIILSVFIFSQNRRFVPPKSLFDKRLILIGLVGGSLPFILYFQGLTQVSATNANLIHKTLFIFVTIMAVPFLKEKLHIVQIIGYLLIIYANFFIGGLTGFNFSAAEGMILFATLLWAVEQIIAKKILKSVSSGLVAWGRMFYGTLILMAVAILTGQIHLIFSLKISQLFPVSGSILLLTLYVFTWYKALKLAPVTLVSSVLILATPVTQILTAIFVSHSFTGETLTQSGLILAGIILIGLFFAAFERDVAPIGKQIQ